jgi:hypothetical protein
MLDRLALRKEQRKSDSAGSGGLQVHKWPLLSFGGWAGRGMSAVRGKADSRAVIACQTFAAPEFDLGSRDI